VERFEVGIVGGGPAGLSAALVLGRCRRRVVLFDSGHYRNAAAHAVHGLLTREGMPPAELRRLGRAELARYPTVEVRAPSVVDARRDGAGFALTVAGGGAVACDKLLLATGLVDRLPEVAGARALYGERLFHCPYCDGWELRDQPLMAYAPGAAGAAYAAEVAQWSRDLVWCSDGPLAGADVDRDRLARRGVAIDERRVVVFEPDGAGVVVRFSDGPPLPRRAVFFHLGCRPGSDLARRLGCALDDKGGVVVNAYEASSVPGLYVAGDASRDVLLVAVAIGEGAAAAVAINAALAAAD